MATAQTRWDRQEKWGADMPNLVTTWTNAVGNGDWNNNSNWDNSKPANGANNYTALFDGNVTNVPPTVNLDQSAVTIDQLTFLESYTGGIGSSSTPLKIEIASTSAPTGGDLSMNCTVLGDGDYYLEFTSGGFSDVVVDQARTGENSVVLGGVVRNLYVKGGDVTVKSTCNLTSRLTVSGSSVVVVTAKASAETSPAYVFIDGGKLDFNRASSGNADAQINCSGGELTYTGSIASVVDITVTGGSFKWIPTAAPGTAPDLYAMGGHTDLSKLRFDVNFGTLVIGPHAEFSTSPSVGYIFSGVGATIDLREILP